jgi:hypothetical protein
MMIGTADDLSDAEAVTVVTGSSHWGVTCSERPADRPAARRPHSHLLRTSSIARRVTR